MNQLLRRPWRQDREAVSAAFSKWARVSMFENTAEGEAGLQAAQEEIERSLLELETNREQLSKMMTGLDDKSAAIARQEKQLLQAKEELQSDAKTLAEQRRAVEGEKARLESERTASVRDLEERRLELESQSKALDERTKASQTDLERERML